MSDEANDIMSDYEAAELLRVGRIMVRKLARRGEIPCQILGESYRFSRLAVMAWLRCEDDPGMPPKSSSRQAWQMPRRNSMGLVRRCDLPPVPDVMTSLCNRLHDRAWAARKGAEAARKRRKEAAAQAGEK